MGKQVGSIKQAPTLALREPSAASGVLNPRMAMYGRRPDSEAIATIATLSWCAIGVSLRRDNKLSVESQPSTCTMEEESLRFAGPVVFRHELSAFVI